MTKSKADKLCVAHYASRYLPLTENWIYRTLINHKKFSPVFLTRKRINLNLFPIDSIYSLDGLWVIQQYAEILFFKLKGYFRFFKNACNENSASILHVHFGYHGVKMIGLKRKLNIPLVCSFYGDDAFAEVYTGRYKKLFKEADRILVLGPYMRSALVKLGCPENKIFIHHLGIDTEKIRFEKRTIKDGPVRFLIASSFLEKKGIDLAIRALAKFKDRYDFSLDIVGDGPLKNQIQTEIENGALEDRVKLHGYQPYEYFINLTYQCHVFIQASKTTKDNRKEGTPMAIVDAMAAGMPVIATRHSDIPEIVKDVKHGYLAEENDVESLIDCIQKLFDNRSKIEGFSLQARQWIESEFDAAIQTRKLEEHYCELIQNPD